MGACLSSDGKHVPQSRSAREAEVNLEHSSVAVHEQLQNIGQISAADEGQVCFSRENLGI
jgi:hypothetical protein